MRNAFDVLTAGAKRSATHGSRIAESTKTPAASKGVYTSCPLCQRTVPLAFAEAHVSVCLATPAPPPSTQHHGSQATPADPVAHTTVMGTTTGTEQQERAPFQSPAQFTGQPVPAGVCSTESKALLTSGARDVHYRPSGSFNLTQQPQQQLTPGPGSSGPAAVIQGCSDSTLRSQQTAAGPSAFDVMRKSQQRAAARCHNFFLERTPDDAWLGHCWPKGCATAAQQRLAASSVWSVTLSVATGGKGGPADGSAGKETVTLLTNVPPGDGGVISWGTEGLISNALPPEGRWRGGPSVIKSALQKAVRLGRGGCAVRAALHLAKEDGGAAQLLRRLSVVCVEDAILHPGLPLVVWLMAAQAKGFTLGAKHLDVLLRLVYQLATVQVRDGLPDSWDGEPNANPFSSIGAQTQGPATLHQVDDLDLPPAEACLVKCLLVRGSYGGMGGDVRMMKAFAAYWAARFRGAAAAPPPASTSHTGDSDCCGAAGSVTPGSQHVGAGSGSQLDVLPSSTRPEPPHAVQGPDAGAALPSASTLGPGLPGHGSSRASVSRGQGSLSRDQDSAAFGSVEEQKQPGLGPDGQVSLQVAPVAALRECQAAATYPDRPVGGGARSDGGTQTALLAARSEPSRGAAGEPNQGSLRGRHSDAYFTVRLQADDAPPSCGAFVPASQLLAEAMHEQQSLSRLAVTTVNRHIQRQWDGGQALSQVQRQYQDQHGQQQQHQTGVSRPRWCVPAAEPEGSQSTQTGVGACDRRCSAWLTYLCKLYDQVPVPAALSEAAAVGPLRRSDVPLSAVDFHVSDVVTRLLERPEVMAAASSRPGTTPEDAEDALKSAMWLFRSCKNPKAWVHKLSPCCCETADAEGACTEHRSLSAQLNQEARRREALAAVWAPASAWADRFSANYIGRRFGPP